MTSSTPVDIRESLKDHSIVENGIENTVQLITNESVWLMVKWVIDVVTSGGSINYEYYIIGYSSKVVTYIIQSVKVHQSGQFVWMPSY